MKKAIRTILFMLFVFFVSPCVQLNAADVTRVIVSEYFLQGYLLEGEEVQLTVVLKNTSKTTEAQSILITFEADDDLVYPVCGESNQVYVENIGPNSTKEVIINLQAAEKIDSDMISLNVLLQYSDSNNVAANNSTTLRLFTEKMNGLEVDIQDVPASAYVGAKTRISLTCSNLMEDISNFQFVLSGRGLEQTVTSDVKELKNGEETTSELYMIFEQPGTQEITLSCIYTNSKKEVITEEIGTFNLVVREVAVTENSEQEEKPDGEFSAETDQENEYVIQMVIMVVVIVIALLLLVSERKRKK